MFGEDAEVYAVRAYGGAERKALSRRVGRHPGHGVPSPSPQRCRSASLPDRKITSSRGRSGGPDDELFALWAGRIEDTLNGFIQQGIELSVGLPRRQPLYEGPRKARHDAVIPAHAVDGLLPRVTARQCNDPQDLGMPDAIGVEVVSLGQRELEHDQLTLRQSVEVPKDGRFEQLFGLGLFRAVNVNFRLDDRHEAGRDDLPGDFE